MANNLPPDINYDINYNVCEDIFHLSGSLNNLMRIDTSVLGNVRKESLKHMKQILFDTLEMTIMSIACDATLDTGEEISDKNIEDDEDEDN